MKSELSSTIIYQVELCIPCPSPLSKFNIVFCVRIVFMFLHKWTIWLNKCLTNWLDEFKNILKGPIVQILEENSPYTSWLLPVCDVKVFVSHIFVLWIVGGVVQVTRILQSFMKVDTITHIYINRCQVWPSSKPPVFDSPCVLVDHHQNSVVSMDGRHKGVYGMNHKAEATSKHGVLINFILLDSFEMILVTHGLVYTLVESNRQLWDINSCFLICLSILEYTRTTISFVMFYRKNQN